MLSVGGNDHAKGVLRPVDAPASALSPLVPAPSPMPAPLGPAAEKKYEEEEEEF